MGPVTFLFWIFLRAVPSPEAAAQLQHAIERVEARYPPVGANDQAMRLEELAAKIGVDLAPPLPDRAHPLLSEKDLVERLKFGGYVSDQVESRDDAIAAPPRDVPQFLDERAETLDTIRALLVNETAPRWSLDLSKGRAADPEPSSTGALVLQRILLTRALAEQRAGRPAEAALWLEASWRLKEATASRPSMVWQLLAIAVSRWEAGVLRKLSAAETPWVDRMRFTAERERAFRVMADEFVIEFIDPPDREELSRWSPMDLLSGMGKAVEELAAQNPCAFTRALANTYWKPFFSGPIEKTLAEIAMPNLGSAAHRLHRMQLEGELTIRVLEARRALSGSESPVAGTAIDAESAACPAARWSTLLLPGGGAHVRFGGRFEEWQDESGIRPPLEFTIRAPASAARP